MVQNAGINRNTPLPTLEALLKEDYPNPDALKTRLYERVHRMRKQRWGILRFFVNKALRKAKHHTEKGVQWRLDNTRDITIKKIVHILERYHNALGRYDHRPGNTKTLIKITGDFLTRQKCLAQKKAQDKIKNEKIKKIKPVHNRPNRISKFKYLTQKHQHKKNRIFNAVTQHLSTPKTVFMPGDPSTYEGETRDGRPNGLGQRVRSDGTTLKGMFTNGKLNGFGTLGFADGRIISGPMENDLPQGLCEMTFTNGEKTTTRFVNGYHKCPANQPLPISDGNYYGDLRFGVPEGYGCFKWSNNITYEGEVKNGKPDGHGVMKWPDGYVFEGEFREGKFKGERPVKLGNTHIGTYYAEFTNGVANGPGRFKWAGGQEIETVFDNDSFFGTYQNAGNFTYEGQFFHGLMQGKGVKKWTNGKSYCGDFYQDLMHGEGVYTTPGKHVYKGEMRKNKINGQGQAWSSDGKVHQGQYLNGTFHGQGILEWPNGWRYEGLFYENDKHGQGKLTGPNGQVYEGVWEEQYLYIKPVIDDFICPVTCALIKEPVDLDGRYYEKEALVKSIRLYKKDPCKNTPLTDERIVEIEQTPIDAEKQKQITDWKNDKKNIIHVLDVVLP